MNSKWTVTFNDGSAKEFSGFWKDIIKEISDYCDKTGLETTGVVRDSTISESHTNPESINESKYLVYVHYYHESDSDPDNPYSEDLISNKIVDADTPDDATKIAENEVKEWCETMSTTDTYEFTYSEPPILLTPEVVKGMNLNPSILDEADDWYEDTPMEQFSTINDLISKRIDDYYEGIYSDESLVTLIRSRLPLIEKIKQRADIDTRSYINQVTEEWTSIISDLEPVIAQDGSNMDDDYDDLEDEDSDDPNAKPYFS